MNFSTWLNEEINKRNWSQSDLARQSGLTRQAISHLIIGRTKTPDNDTIEKLARAFDLPIEVVYQKANLLPAKSKRDELEEEAAHLFAQLKDKQTALKLLRALGGDDDEKKTTRTGSGNSHAIPR